MELLHNLVIVSSSSSFIFPAHFQSLFLIVFVFLTFLYFQDSSILEGILSIACIRSGTVLMKQADAVRKLTISSKNDVSLE